MDLPVTTNKSKFSAIVEADTRGREGWSWPGSGRKQQHVVKEYAE